MGKSNLVFTGGHAGTTAIAVVEEIVKQKKDWQIYWIGPKKTFEGKNVVSFHEKSFSKLGVITKSISGGRLQAKFTRFTILSLLKVPISFIQAFSILLKIKPKLIVSFGGYTALPVVVAGWILRIPIIIHEQTVAVGLANKISGNFARKIAIARKESEKYFPPHKTILVGNPLLSSVKEASRKTRMGNPPTIYITGGSSGAQIINRAVDGVLEKLLENYQVIHHTGELDIEYFEKRKASLPANLSRNYEVESFFDPSEIGKVYGKADILVSRGGANTVAEIIATKRPSIIIPIPWTRYDEQTKNAQMAQNIGVAAILNQSDLTPELLYKKIEVVAKNWDKMAMANSEISELDRAAAGSIVNLIEESL